MDDVVQDVLEQLAFDGSVGTPIPRFWLYVGAHYNNRNLEQILDKSLKDYLWQIFLQCTDFLIGVKSTGDMTIRPVPHALLDSLLETHGEGLVVGTTEERQWTTLTGHTIDHKKVSREFCLR